MRRTSSVLPLRYECAVCCGVCVLSVRADAQGEPRCKRLPSARIRTHLRGRARAERDLVRPVYCGQWYDCRGCAQADQKAFTMRWKTLWNDRFRTPEERAAVLVTIAVPARRWYQDQESWDGFYARSRTRPVPDWAEEHHWRDVDHEDLEDLPTYSNIDLWRRYNDLADRMAWWWGADRKNAHIAVRGEFFEEDWHRYFGYLLARLRYRAKALEVGFHYVGSIEYTEAGTGHLHLVVPLSEWALLEKPFREVLLRLVPGANAKVLVGKEKRYAHGIAYCAKYITKQDGKGRDGLTRYTPRSKRRRWLRSQDFGNYVVGPRERFEAYDPEEGMVQFLALQERRLRARLNRWTKLNPSVDHCGPRYLVEAGGYRRYRRNGPACSQHSPPDDLLAAVSGFQDLRETRLYWPRFEFHAFDEYEADRLDSSKPVITYYRQWSDGRLDAIS